MTYATNKPKTIKHRLNHRLDQAILCCCCIHIGMYVCMYVWCKPVSRKCLWYRSFVGRTKRPANLSRYNFENFHLKFTKISLYSIAVAAQSTTTTTTTVAPAPAPLIHWQVTAENALRNMTGRADRQAGLTDRQGCLVFWAHFRFHFFAAVFSSTHFTIWHLI